MLVDKLNNRRFPVAGGKQANKRSALNFTSALLLPSNSHYFNSYGNRGTKERVTGKLYEQCEEPSGSEAHGDENYTSLVTVPLYTYNAYITYTFCQGAYGNIVIEPIHILGKGEIELCQLTVH
ncbi:hypothetical protein KQX54_021447 [Cotesia glomerata]|uniref:Uncharacterized protein n=1 Tax=Cotesia glomerata TaxID=32391 RepID=A0AAV7J914_COTGL|nr:hypothetical protein KQX54_021447 [Cotesia glomerata]